ncbi:family 43 glycosylhydrolase [Arthrobacter sp. CDRTa11]|uniref:glycoside hydrolase family 43 protein n=1 Tax=Arthrobacter sp. CDRTa11 TaxID=2651199 RepID=UPI00226583A9|nr:family 43 glycosylhydrolase [Arthrobacter sp. CDRTa11]UZX01425.1 family 43 glycosylhydrolase [Arthrobacter sp. CDRTa11]
MPRLETAAGPASPASPDPDITAPDNTDPGLPDPFILQRADPWMTRHQGRYYFTASVPEYDRLVIRQAPSLAGLGSAPEATIWQRPASGPLGGHIWAPELHHFDGGWHLYFAAGDSDDPFRIRMYVMSNPETDPAAPAWGPPVRIHTHKESFSLDATTFEHGGTRFLVWAQMDPDSSLFIAPLSSPSTLAGPPVRIADPTLGWEIIGHRVNEGPAVIQRNGRIFLTFSASATDANYCMGLLTADAGADLLDPSSWTKDPLPWMATSDRSGEFGPGHNSFTLDEAGNDLIVYHSRSYRDVMGDPLRDPNRHTRIRRIHWSADGRPSVSC